MVPVLIKGKLLSKDELMYLNVLTFITLQLFIFRPTTNLNRFTFVEQSVFSR